MKPNRVKRHDYRKAVVMVISVAVLAVVAAVVIGYGKLQDTYLEQGLIVSMSDQVSITSGEMVKADVIADNLGLKVGANISLIDFDQKRAELLKRVPTLKSVSITREMPNRVVVVTEERTPIAKLGIRGYRKTTGRVVDSEGMVFPCLKGTQLLPTISEPQSPGTAIGHLIRGRALAALKFIEACREPEFSDLSVQDVDISKPDFLLATLGDYSKVKIAWDDMDETTPAARASLGERLDNLIKAMRSRIGTGTVIWNATMPGTIFADSQGKL